MPIQSARIQHYLDTFAQFSPADQAGMNRLTLTTWDKQARDYLREQMTRLGMECHIDPLGNMIGILGKELPGAPLAIGSHLDTVAQGGRFDGILGVVAGLEIAEALLEEGHTLNKPLAIINFTNEEGNRFAPDMMGSAYWARHLELDTLYNCQDSEGVRLEDALDAIRYKGSYPSRDLVPEAFLELHIEQGPLLEAQGLDLGIVEHVQGVYWTEYTFTGAANHAGTTPPSYRQDAGLAAMRLAIQAEDYAKQKAPEQRITIGQIQFSPNQINIIPGTARMSIDNRHPDPDVLEKTQAYLDQSAQELAEVYKVKVSSQALARVSPVNFDATLIDELEVLAQEKSIKHQVMISGAGHDAQLMSHICPSAMLFVPSKGGISHNPAEFTEIEPISQALQLMFLWVLKRNQTSGQP